MARYLQSIKTFLTCELSQYSKSGSMFSSSEPVAIHTNMCTMYLACTIVCTVVTNVVCIESVFTIMNSIRNTNTTHTNTVRYVLNTYLLVLNTSCYVLNTYHQYIPPIHTTIHANTLYSYWHVLCCNTCKFQRNTCEFVHIQSLMKSSIVFWNSLRE